jgi:hypothetical protein
MEELGFGLTEMAGNEGSQFWPEWGVTEDDITENAITLVFSRTVKSYNQKTP